MKPFFFFCLLLGCLTSCETLYVANPVTTPLFSQEGEFQAQGSAGSNGFNVGVALAPAKHFALMANGATYTVEFDSIQEPRFRTIFGEAGIGYWTPIDKYWRFETYSGMGWGITRNTPVQDFYRRFFIQPNVGYSSEYFDFGVASRFSFVGHTDQRNSTTMQFQPTNTSFWEPSIMFRAGYRELKFQMQGGLSLPMTSSEFDFRQWTISFGANLTLGKDFDRYSFTYD